MATYTGVLQLDELESNPMQEILVREKVKIELDDETNTCDQKSLGSCLPLQGCAWTGKDCVSINSILSDDNQVNTYWLDRLEFFGKGNTSQKKRPIKKRSRRSKPVKKDSRRTASKSTKKKPVKKDSRRKASKSTKKKPSPKKTKKSEKTKKDSKKKAPSRKQRKA